MPEKAAQSLETLLARDPANIKALALLIRSYSLFDAPRAHEVALRLPEIDIPSDIDLEQLEIGVGVTSGRGLRKVIQPEEEKINEANRRFETKEKKRKKKKGKLPKELVEGGPDPERWIPRQERSYYRRKKRNRNDAIGKGSQGLSSVNKAAEAALDMSDKPKKIEEESKPNKPTPTPPPQPKQQSSKPKSKPKKKGKGKW
jgi:signal recognition particle subunit SRP72